MITTVISGAFLPLKQLPATPSSGMTWLNASTFWNPQITPPRVQPDTVPPLQTYTPAAVTVAAGLSWMKRDIPWNLSESRQQPIIPYPLKQIYTVPNRVAWINKSTFWNPQHYFVEIRLQPVIPYPLKTYSAPAPSFVPAHPNNVFDIILLDQYGNPFVYLNDKDVALQWDYNRIGGCGQAAITISKPYDWNLNAIAPKFSIQLYMSGQLRYWGKILKVNRKINTGSESIKITFYGYVNDLSKQMIRKTYTGQEVSVIVKDILDTVVTPNTEITYSASDIDSTDYAVASLTFNHTVKDAMSLLATLGANIEWGVDRNKKFFFKKQDNVIRRVYVIGRDIVSHEYERDDEPVINKCTVYGANGQILSVTSSQSIGVFGSRDINVFESAITEASDAARLGVVTLQAANSSVRTSKFTIKKPDEFVEPTFPLGAVGVNDVLFNQLNKYGTGKKYGTGLKYGNINRDQFLSLRYTLDGGGISIDVNLNSDVLNLGDLQKKVQLEVSNLQRR